MAGRGMDDEPGGLVDDQQVVVLVDDLSGMSGSGSARADGSGTTRRSRGPGPTTAFARSGARRASGAVGDQPLDVARDRPVASATKRSARLPAAPSRHRQRVDPPVTARSMGASRSSGSAAVVAAGLGDRGHAG